MMVSLLREGGVLLDYFCLVFLFRDEPPDQKYTVYSQVCA